MEKQKYQVTIVSLALYAVYEFEPTKDFLRKLCQEIFQEPSILQPVIGECTFVKMICKQSAFLSLDLVYIPSLVGIFMLKAFFYSKFPNSLKLCNLAIYFLELWENFLSYFKKNRVH